MKKPLIGITCNYTEHNIHNVNIRYYQDVSSSYTKAIENAGGLPVIIPNNTDKETLIELADRLDGFLFTGGVDVDPSFYGKEDDGTMGEVTIERDQTEIDLLKYVIYETEKPVFGICRGIQVINVAMGGTLIMDLPTAGKNIHSFSEKPRELFTHEIVVEEDSRLKEILEDEVRVNSFHHQAVDRLADGLRITAHSKDDGVIEAYELPGERYLLAVQWHPEELTHTKAHARLFEELVRQSSK